MRWLIVAPCLFAFGAGSAVVAQETDAEPDDGAVVVEDVETMPTLPLVEVPVGCEPWQLADVVFIGSVVARDSKTVRFADITVRAGDDTLISAGGTVDIRFGYDAQYVAEGETYLVGADEHPDLGILVSKLTQPPDRKSVV